MKIPYIRVKQRGEIFFVTKLKASFLRDHVVFHFRDPYLKYQSNEATEKIQDYLAKITRKGIDLKSSDEGIQRRLQIQRINDIRKYIELNPSNFFPNSILLSVDVTKINNFENQYMVLEQEEFGYFEFPEDLKISVVDGQHRLAGLLTSNEKIIEDFEIVAVLLFNISISTAAKLFSDINGKQKPVNRSLIYDLSSEITSNDMLEIKNFHAIAMQFYTDEKSPLFRQIKMLGIGKGSISQAFFIEYTKDAIKKTDLCNKPIQEIYNQLYYYFRSFQKVFPEDWPVPLNFNDFEEIDKYADKVLRERNSQLVKTNGFGAILKLFPDVYKKSDGTFNSYLNVISKLEGKISWTINANKPRGTGKQFQDHLVKIIREELFRESN